MKNILLLDDDPYIHKAVTMLLDSDNYSITFCTTTRQALKQMEAKPPMDLILLDIALSENDSGFTFLRATRDKDITIPIIVLTAVSDIDIIIDIFRSGATDIIRKPHLHLLKKAIHDITRKTRSANG